MSPKLDGLDPPHGGAFLDPNLVDGNIVRQWPAFECHLKLQIGSVEIELSWIPHFLDRIDYTYPQRVQQDHYRFKEAMLPSDYIHRNVFYGFQEDGMSIKLRVTLGTRGPGQCPAADRGRVRVTFATEPIALCLLLGHNPPRLTGRQDGPLYNALAIDPGQNCW